MERIERISEEIKREMSGIIQNELKDPRLSKLISITHLNVTKDLRYAKFMSALWEAKRKKQVHWKVLKVQPVLLDGKSAAGYK